MGADQSQQADALLGELHRQASGKLTVFLGAAPGVGKTFAMLARARELQRQGVDIVVGIAETHGRSETHALLDGLSIFPRQTLAYRGRALEELDLDGLLARKPTVVLVDELAHRNVPGSRHERRWQDVVELLNAGIDVYTTVNVQHMESLNDVVYELTGVRVRETVPDAVFEHLRDIRLVDLPPRELIERLNQGKVYLPEQASRALGAFFSPSNLAGLRELAMQTVAEHVDADWREARAARGLDALAIQRHVLIAIDGKGQSEYLVRAGARIAERRGVPWTVITVNTLQADGEQASLALSGGAASGKVSEDELRQLEIDKAFALARALGGETEMLYNSDIVQALLDAAELRSAQSIVIGRTRERWFARILNRTLTQQILTRGTRYELTIVSTPKPRRSALTVKLPQFNTLLTHDAWLAVLASVGAAGVALLAERLFGLRDVSLIFLVAVVLVASRTWLRPAIVTAVLCFLAYNLLFIEPHFTFRIYSLRGLSTVVLFLAAALIAGSLASRLRMQVLALRAANAHAKAMQKLGRRLANAADLGQVMQAGTSSLESSLNAQVWLRIHDQEGPAAHKRHLTEKDRVAADWAQQHGQFSGRYTDTLSSVRWWFVPIQSDQEKLGVVGIRFADDLVRLPFEQRRLAERMADDIGQAALRTQLVEALERARVSSEAERLRSALLSSVSHDLRSPLSSMIGAADSLLHYAKDMDAADQQALLQSIHEEGERLDRYIQNLLDMTRLGQEGLVLQRDWMGVDELLGLASQRLQKQLPNLSIAYDIEKDLPPIHAHPALLEQALFNVMENAAKFSAPGQALQISAKRAPNGLLALSVTDSGPGIPEAERKRIFDMFYSVERGDRGRQGTGLGLTIVKGIVDAHEGQVEALPAPQGTGTTIRITLPWGEYAPHEAPDTSDTSDISEAQAQAAERARP